MVAQRLARSHYLPRDATLHPVPQSTFFNAQLPGEPPLRIETARELCLLAKQIDDLEPWDVLTEEQLFFAAGRPGESLACSVMGALGETFAFTVYRGDSGLAWFNTIQNSKLIDPGQFVAEQESLYVEFVKRNELTKPDRQLLTEVEYPMIKGGRVPIFRASRFGYHPWFINDDEGRILAGAMAAAVPFYTGLDESRELPYWGNEREYPYVSVSGGKISITRHRPPAPSISMPAIPALDERRVNAQLRKNSKRQGILELDTMWMPVQVGRPAERKACVRIALAIDSATAFAFPPGSVGPETPLGTVLTDTVLGALETGASPQTIHVKDRQYRALIEPLGKALGIEVKVVSELPALDFAKSSLIDMMMGGPTPF